MRHRRTAKKLGRGGAHRKAMIRNLLTSLVTHEKIQTTKLRCKVLKREVDKLITLGKKGTVHARRLAAERLYTKDAVSKLFDELAPRYTERAGGYSRIMLTGPRRGDAADMGIIELLPAETTAAPAAEEKTEE
jgi:large subunit ribosomal protein L17